MQLNNDECSKEKGERERKEERRKSVLPMNLENKFPMEAKTRKETVEGGGGQEASSVRD